MKEGKDMVWTWELYRDNSGDIPKDLLALGGDRDILPARQLLQDLTNR